MGYLANTNVSLLLLGPALMFQIVFRLFQLLSHFQILVGDLAGVTFNSTFKVLAVA